MFCNRYGPHPYCHINKFIAHLSLKGYKHSTVSAYLAGISFYFMLHCGIDPKKQFMVQKYYRARVALTNIMILGYQSQKRYSIQSCYNSISFVTICLRQNYLNSIFPGIQCTAPGWRICKFQKVTQKTKSFRGGMSNNRATKYMSNNRATKYT